VNHSARKEGEHGSEDAHTESYDIYFSRGVSSCVHVSFCSLQH
jgi:hypothetical protein